MTSILFLGYPKCRLLDSLHERTEVFQTMRPIKDRVLERFDLTICFGYRFILRPQALTRAVRPPINLHISYLPFNRGADPNYWSFHDGTPKGVTIHEIDESIDSGPIIFRQRVAGFYACDTLKSTYSRLYDTWPQPDGGSYHSVGEMPALPSGWDTGVMGLGKEAKPC
jgi:methionyl-tRNA formyltransferase